MVSQPWLMVHSSFLIMGGGRKSFILTSRFVNLHQSGSDVFYSLDSSSLWMSTWSCFKVKCCLWIIAPSRTIFDLVSASRLLPFPIITANFFECHQSAVSNCRCHCCSWSPSSDRCHPPISTAAAACPLLDCCSLSPYFPDIVFSLAVDAVPCCRCRPLLPSKISSYHQLPY